MVSALLIWALASAGMDRRAMWLGGGLLSLAALAMVATSVPAAPVPSAEQVASEPAAVDARLKLLSLAYGLFGFGDVITATFIVVIVRASPAAAPMEPIFWLVLGLAAIPSVVVWVGVGRRLWVVRAFAVASVVEAVACSPASPGRRWRAVPCRRPARRHLHGPDRARPHRRA